MSATFYLVRHGKKEKGTGDVSISSDGLLQAQATARYFRGMPIAAVVSSPLKRAKETAAIIAKEANSAFVEDVRLRERANWGDLPGQAFEEFVEMWDRCTRDRDYIPPVGDSARGAGERLTACLKELAEGHRGECVVIVTHGGLITDFLVNVIPEEELNVFYPDFLKEQSRLIHECSITKVSLHSGKFSLEGFGSIAHLI
ncbi:histidine phosphatase family protein [Paenibacillus thermotolerans]|uniref:histidine phosphatase family protein n=1 Tax=Paenibacillus thermotolerans TaxID=3027807 RepID=UPI002368DE26|nr:MULTISPECIES: histidine phosphatase family protein [unclassified Paenibacillus]